MNEVITWLRTREGELWSSARNSTLQRHWEDSGVFADVISEDRGMPRLARWPEPYGGHDLDAPEDSPLEAFVRLPEQSGQEVPA